MKKRRTKSFLIGITVSLIILVALGAALFVIFDIGNWQTLDPDKLHALAQTSSIYDKNGELISVIRGPENRTVLPLSSIPKHTQLAFIAAEDLRFYTHKGIDVYRILGALRSNLKSGSLAEGASTITQQLAKLTHLSSEKTIRRKLEEISLAFQIERQYSKDEILEMYLNTVYFGRGAYGIQAGAKVFFGVDASELTIAQSACLAAAIKAPSVYAAHISPQSNQSRRNFILSTMAENGFISKNEYDTAVKERIWVLAESEDIQVSNWYVDEVIRESTELLGMTSSEVISGGLSIYTAYDPNLQKTADQVYANAKLFPSGASDGTPVQSAMAVIDTHTGAIRAMIGGRDYAVKSGLNRATQMRRQPGSALKPLSVYGPALEKGYTTASVLLDEKTSFSGGYTPQNAGDRY